MTEKKKINSALACIDSGLIVHGRQAVEVLNDFHAENRRDPGYRQIQPGHLQLQLLVLKLGRIELFRDRMNRQPGWPATPVENPYSIIVALSDFRGY